MTYRLFSELTRRVCYYDREVGKLIGKFTARILVDILDYESVMDWQLLT
jgi:hypothetical protein